MYIDIEVKRRNAKSTKSSKKKFDPFNLFDVETSTWLSSLLINFSNKFSSFAMQCKTCLLSNNGFNLIFISFVDLRISLMHISTDTYTRTHTQAHTFQLNELEKQELLYFRKGLWTNFFFFFYSIHFMQEPSKKKWKIYRRKINE